MFSKAPFLFLFLFTSHLFSQLTCTPKDSLLFKEKIQSIRNLDVPVGELPMVAIGLTFLEQPYVEKTLEIGEEETLVINLRGFDCTTYVENVLAFSMMAKNRTEEFGDFVDNLKTIRYRNGILNGYPSRLHYFTDWIRNNEQKGLVKDITSEIGGKAFQKAINFMGTHRSLYPFLQQDENFEAMLRVEQGLAEETLCVLAQEDIQKQEHLMQSGDIIALATSIKGLDVTHTGIAIKRGDRIHLLHASSAGTVRITKVPLVDYLKKIKSNTGIIVARPNLLSP